MESKTNYTVVGLAVLILAAGLIIIGLWLSIGFDRKSYHRYIVFIDESVGGLSTESPVNYNGVRVGSVTDISLCRFDPQKIKVVIKVEDGTPVTTNTYATLITKGITGTTYLGLSTDSASFIPIQKTPGQPYPVIPYKPSFLNRLQNEVMDISDGFERLLSRENTQNLKKALINLEKISTAFANNERNINEALEQFPKAVREFQGSAHKFSAMSDEMTKAGEEVSETMVSAKATLDKLQQQAIPEVMLLIRRIDSIAANLQKVSAQMRTNPAVIIRGSTPPKPGPGERK